MKKKTPNLKEVLREEKERKRISITRAITNQGRIMDKMMVNLYSIKITQKLKNKLKLKLFYLEII